MRFKQTGLPGSHVIELEELSDERGFFARAWCSREFKQQGLSGDLAQINVSYNAKKGTLRGLHFQAPPHQEAKVLRCTRGSIFDVIVDLRPDSECYLKSFGTVLSASNRQMLYVPEGCAHGFQTLEGDTEVLYLMSKDHAPDAARGVRYNDPAFGIEWPLSVSVISDRDARWSDFVGRRTP